MTLAATHRDETGAVVQIGAPRQPRLVLIGTGTVGGAFVARHQRLTQRGFSLPAFEWLANSRGTFDCVGAPDEILRSANEAERGGEPSGIGTARLRSGDFLIDATASDAIASRHAEWLSRGLRVITANKLGNGADLLRAQAIARAQREGQAHYGDSATVGAGLPLLRSIRELVAGGDRVHAVEGVLSGSLAWLFDRYDGSRPFSGFVREARAAGYTEPDPRTDLSGEDVRRKLLILARAAGIALEAHEVRVDSLVPGVLAAASDDELDAGLSALDTPLRHRHQDALRHGAKLRFVARFDASVESGGRASVGLCALSVDHPLCGGSATDNRVAIHSDRYRQQPLVIQGAGAGAEVTAAALLDDVLRILQSSQNALV